MSEKVVNAVAASFNTGIRQMTGMSQRKVTQGLWINVAQNIRNGFMEKDSGLPKTLTASM